MATELKDTLLLPKTDFPMRAGLAQREPGRVAHWEKLDLYNQIQAKRANSAKGAFVLHDGPPFTNGDVHIGTALNKTLKDIVNRYKSMQGFRTPYVPGWDCHGLPIEQKVSNALPKGADAALIRSECDKFSEGWIAKQTTQFKRVGVLADWKNEYKTKAPAFEAGILRSFAEFAEKELIYRSKKPVYYSIPFETALAEAEIEYKDHTSIAIWVKFLVPVAEAQKFGLPTDKPLYIVIWTTTPWTMPANLAIALHSEVEYGVYTGLTKNSESLERLIVAKNCFANFQRDTGFGTRSFPITRVDERGQPTGEGESPMFTDELYHLDLTIAGARLEGLQARHPFIDRASPVVLADYVTTDSGTGAVHTAPGHGADDYLTGRKYGLPIYCPVNGQGIYADDVDYLETSLRLPPELIGVITLETVEDLAAKRTSPANIAVLKMLAGANALLAKAKYSHSYPHCWRSKTPIIFLATHQWFVSLDRSGVRTTALAEIDRIAADKGWIPAWGEARIRGAVESRPDWCISRNRRWGVPIPAFYHNNNALRPDRNVILALAEKLETQGVAFWEEWFGSKTSENILAGITLPSDWPQNVSLNQYSHCQDTLDVWMDSGSSHVFLRNFLHREFGVDPKAIPADLYLEGSDQHRGWFQSSLWNSVIAFGAAPYKAVLTHGFIVDKNRQKISKSSTYQKPQTADAYIAQHGADVIRLWIASQDFRDDIPVDDEILKHVGEAYRLFRNTLRFQLSTLFDFDVAKHAVPVEKMDALDRWALHKTHTLIEECTKAYDAYEFHRVYQLCNQFCSVTLSATYHDILKDRLYTLGSAHPLRRSAQTAIAAIFDALVKILAPFITFTADEAWSYAKTGQEYSNESIHLQDWPVAPAAWRNAEIEADFATLFQVRAKVTETLEPLRQAGTIGKSLDAVVTLGGADETATRVLEKHRGFLPELFIVSDVTLAAGTGAAPTARHAKEAGHTRCPRCWRWVPKVVHTPHGEVCPRCEEALNS